MAFEGFTEVRLYIEIRAPPLLGIIIRYNKRIQLDYRLKDMFFAASSQMGSFGSDRGFEIISTLNVPAASVWGVLST